jgi:membrane protein required for colicin V production
MWFDIVTLVIIGIAAYRGSQKGFLWQLATIAGIVFCFLFAGQFSVALAPMLKIEPPLSRWVSIFILYIVSSLIAYGLASGLRKGLEKVRFEDYDEHLGGIFGAVKGAVFCIVLTFFGVTLSASVKESIMTSFTGYASAWFLMQVEPVLPEEFKNVIAPYVSNLTPEMIAKLKEENARKQQQNSGNNTPNPFPYNGTSPFPNGQNPTNVNQNTNPWESVNNNPVINAQQKAMIDDAMTYLPKFFSQEMRDAIRKTLEQASDSQRQMLIEKLKTATPVGLQQLAIQLMNMSNQFQNQQPGTQSELDKERLRLQLKQKI